MQNPTEQSNTVEKGFQPVCERLLLRENSPTKAPKMLDKGLRPLCWDVFM
ncbi:MAG: hypothetical protein FWC11_00675 [Firmicutes bacterium]|nr:hypothetical protein [Bacillota bacterium]